MERTPIHGKHEKMFNLRKVTKDDTQLLFDWANEPEARANAMNPKVISWDEHVAWLNCKLLDDSVYMHIFKEAQKDAGVIRFEKSPEGFIISYSIDKDHRGKGLGTTILKKGMDNLREVVENPVFIGYVKKGNIASEKIFDRLNFSVEKKELINGVEFIIYKKQDE